MAAAVPTRKSLPPPARQPKIINSTTSFVNRPLPNNAPTQKERDSSRLCFLAKIIILTCYWFSIRFCTDFSNTIYDVLKGRGWQDAKQR